MLLTCLSIFFARIIDVSIATFRTMIMVKKKSFITPILAFCEVFIWFMAARKALNTEINSIMIPICYSLGYATGTYLGGFLSRKFIKNINTIEVTTKRNNKKLINNLRNRGLALSIIELKESYNKENKDLIIIDVKSKLTVETIKLIKEIDDKAFIVVRDTKIVHNGFIK
jgi:uncharacterized protein YebE (UPF0316 family)